MSVLGMLSDIKIYKNCKIEYGKNFIVDGIEDYLSTLTTGLIHYDAFQYQKIQYSMNVKVPFMQWGLDMLSKNNYNYMSITNYQIDDPLYTTKTYYFFIIKKEWRAEESVNFQIVMDTINTFKPSTDFTFDGRTHRNREHKNRYVATQESYEEGFTITGKTSLIDGTYKFVYTASFPYGTILNLTSGTGESPTPADLSVTFAWNNTLHTYTITATYGSEVNVSIPCRVMYTGYKKIIDTFPEGLEPILYKQQEKLVYEDLDCAWNLMYKNNDIINPDKFNQVNPISVYLIPDDNISVSVRTSGFVIYPNDFSFLSGSQTAQFGVVQNNGVIFKTSKGNFVIKSEYSTYGEIPTDRRDDFWISIKIVGSTITLSYYQSRYERQGNSPYTLRISKAIKVVDSITQIDIDTELDKIQYGIDTLTPSGYFSNTPFSTAYLNSFVDIDRTDSQIIKIIKLPYCPIELTMGTGGDYILPNGWKYDSTTGFIKASEFVMKMQNELTSISPIEKAKTTYLDINVNASRTSEPEDNKLLNSSFYRTMMAYDSFAYPFEMEKVDVNNLGNKMIGFKMNFVTSNTCNSRFLFDFKGYPLKMSLENYDKILNIARNNEVTIYSNQYINYLRTGYNYDVKAKERQDIASYVGFATGLVGNIASVGMGIVSGNPAVAVTSAISSTSSLVNTIINTANSIAQREANLEQKIAQLKAQSTSVAGSDDLDLLEYYSGNRLKFVEYRCSDKVYNALKDLFYYSGYATDELGSPDMTSRAWFNFVACDLVMNTIAYIPAEIEADIISKYAEGVFFLHKRNSTWNFDLNKANWEVSLL